MLKGIVFDLDGTLVNSLGVTFDAINHATKSLTNRVFTPKEIMRFFGLGESKIIAGLIGSAYESMGYDLYFDFVAQNMHRVALFEGALELLQNLRHKNLPLSICTGRSEPTTIQILKQHKIYDWFELVITDDHVKSPKPAPEGLLEISKHLKLKPQDLLFIGDTRVDILAAQAARAKSGAATWDHLFDPIEMKRLNPDYWFGQMSDIFSLVKNIK